MRIVVTGTAGAVGTYIVDKLLDIGHMVTAVDLPGTKTDTRENVIPHHSDLTRMPYEEMKKLVRAQDAVIHTAAIVDIGKSLAEIWPLNVEVTRKLAQAASEEFFCKFIHISSGSTYAPSSLPIRETDRQHASNAYEGSKISSEQAVINVAKQAADDFEFSILRPALIYGPRARFLGATLAAIPPILEALKLTKIGISGGPITNWVHAEDVARACIHCLTTRSTDNNIYNVADDRPTPFGDTASDYMEVYGLNLLGRIPLPPIKVLRLLKPLIDNNTTFDLINYPLIYTWKQILDSNKLESKLSVKVDREAAPYVFHNTVFDNSALNKTGFHLKWPDHKKAIPQVLSWYKKEGWIP